MKYEIRLNYGVGDSTEAYVTVGEFVSGTFGIEETNLLGGKDVFWCTDADLDGEIYASRPYMEFFPVKTGVIKISSESELRRIGNDPAYPLCGRYILTQDIELSQSLWTPIGEGFRKSFNGVFHGGGHTIKELKLSCEGEHDCGLFSAVRGGIVRELNIELACCSLKGKFSNIGGVAGFLWHAKVERVSVKGGEIFLAAADRDAHISAFGGEDFCCNVGGIAGNALESSVSNSFTAINIQCQGDVTAGGIIGGLSSRSTIEKCYSVGDIEGGHIAGGIAGSVNYAAVSGCHAYGSVRAGTFAGGIAGSLNPGRLENSFYAGTDISAFLSARRLAGRQTNEHFERETEKYYFKNNFASSKAAVNGKPVKTSLTNGKSVSLEKLSDSQFLMVNGLPYERENFSPARSVRFDFEGGTEGSDLIIVRTAILPTLSSIKFPKPIREGYFFDGFIFEGKPFTSETPITRDITVHAVWKKDIDISSAEELLKIGNSEEYPLNGNYRLKADIELDADKPWIPIGGKVPFTGIFDGEGHTISGVYLTFGNYAGLFGHIRRAAVKNLYVVLSKADLRKPEDEYGDDFMAGVVGLADNSHIERVLLTGAGIESHGWFKGFGGIAAIIKNSSIIKECCSLIGLTGDYIGGLCGKALCNSVIDSSFSVGALDGCSVSGILSSTDDSSFVQNSYSASDITSTSGGNQIANIEPKLVKNSVYLGVADFKTRNDHCDNKESYLIEGDKTSKEYYVNSVKFGNFDLHWRVPEGDGGYPYPVLKWIKKGGMRKLNVRFLLGEEGAEIAETHIISANIGAHLFPKPQKEGYTLTGWLDKKTGKAVNPFTYITEDMTLTAVFEVGETKSEQEGDFVEKLEESLKIKRLNM
jgi:hypothetical protein